MRFWVGGYSADMEGNADGIGELHAGDADAALAGGTLSFRGTSTRMAGSPSWLSAHPTRDVVYATLEAQGAIQAFRRTGASSFVRLGAAVEVGALPCHVAVSPDASMLIASCWGDGGVVALPLDSAGQPGSARVAASATDPYADLDPSIAFAADDDVSRETGIHSASGMMSTGGASAADVGAAARALRAAVGGEFAHLLDGLAGTDEPEEVVAARVADDPDLRVSRAHQACFLSGGLIATTDLGFDTVRFWRRGERGLRSVGQVVLPRGTGPRHMLFHPSGYLYVATEHSREVYVLGPDQTGRWRIVGGTAVSPATLEGDAVAEIAASRDQEFLYIGVRGSDTIATLRVRGAGDLIEGVALADAGVAWPRHHVVERDTLLVAGQHADQVASLSLDTRSGVVGKVRSRTQVPSPTCLLPAR